MYNEIFFIIRDKRDTKIYYETLVIIIEKLDLIHKELTLLLLSASFFEGKNEPFILKNASNLTHEFLYENSCVNLGAFSRRNG